MPNGSLWFSWGLWKVENQCELEGVQSPFSPVFGCQQFQSPIVPTIELIIHLMCKFILANYNFGLPGQIMSFNMSHAFVHEVVIKALAPECMRTRV